MKNILKGGLILSLLILGAHSVKADTDIYILDTSNKIGIVDLTNDSVTVLGSVGAASLTGIAFTANGNFYGTSQTALYSLNPTTGAEISMISAYPTGLGSGQMDDAVGYGNNLLVGSDYTNKLYPVDVSPFSTSTLTGSANGDTQALAFGSAGTSGPLYAVLTNGNIDAITISGTTITSAAVLNSSNTGLTSLATVGGVTYGINGTKIYAVDTTTGALSSLVFNYSGHGLGNAHDASALLAVPEPGSLKMVLAGLLALAFYQSRKRAARA